MMIVMTRVCFQLLTCNMKQPLLTLALCGIQVAHLEIAQEEPEWGVCHSKTRPCASHNVGWHKPAQWCGAG